MQNCIEFNCCCTINFQHKFDMDNVHQSLLNLLMWIRMNHHFHWCKWTFRHFKTIFKTKNFIRITVTSLYVSTTTTNSDSLNSLINLASAALPKLYKTNDCWKYQNHHYWKFSTSCTQLFNQLTSKPVFPDVVNILVTVAPDV
jgi:hypothetical protein